MSTDSSSTIPSLLDVTSPPYVLLARVLGRPIASVTASPLGGGGFSGVLTRLQLAFCDGCSRTLVVKTHSAGRQINAAAMGLAREALVYAELGPRLRAAVPGGLPMCLFAAGDMVTGEKFILLEDLADSPTRRCVDSGLCFGPDSPMNWTRKADVEAAEAIASPEDVARSAFTLAARWHAAFWQDTATVQQCPWLRGAARLSGEGRKAWEVMQAEAGAYWAATEKGEGPNGSSLANWDPTLVACIRASLAKVSWSDATAALAASPWTIVHGDFHPGNGILVYEASGGVTVPSSSSDGSSEGGAVSMRALLSPLRSVFVDFENVGIGSGPAELGQYMISHMAPGVRRGCEQRLVREYYDTLIASGVDPADMPWGACWAEYAAGGIAKWVWMFALLTGLCPPPMLAFWADQLSAFITDHGITPDTIQQPRV